LSERYCICELEEYFPATAFSKSRIGILGGTFNPIHNGHIQMAVDAHNQFALSKVLFIPTGRPPHKEQNTIAKDTHRLAMLEIALEEPYMHILPIEIDRKGTTYAVDTLLALNKCFKDKEFYYIIGSDTLMTLNKWKDIDVVLGLTNFIVFLRSGDNPEIIMQIVDFYNASSPNDFLVADQPGLPISSTDIRFRLFNHLSLTGFIPQGVINYIKENKVYTP